MTSKINHKGRRRQMSQLKEILELGRNLQKEWDRMVSYKDGMVEAYIDSGIYDPSSSEFEDPAEDLLSRIEDVTFYSNNESALSDLPHYIDSETWKYDEFSKDAKNLGKEYIDEGSNLKELQDAFSSAIDTIKSIIEKYES